MDGRDGKECMNKISNEQKRAIILEFLYLLKKENIEAIKYQYSGVGLSYGMVDLEKIMKENYPDT